MKKNADGMLAPAGSAGELLLLAPGIDELAEFGYKFVADIDSTNMSPGVWKKLVQAIFAEYNNYDGFVVAHGTDTMAYTASALSFALQNLSKPVILTGSQKPIYELASDAPNNLINAVKVALTDVPEICIVFGTKILRGNRAQKKSESQLNAFWSPMASDLGFIALEPQIEAGRIWQWASREFRFNPDFESGIAFYQLFPGLNGRYIDAAIDNGCRGIILNSYGAGNVPEILLPTIRKAVSCDIPVIITTQCAEGSTRLIYEAGYAALKAGAVSAFDMTPEAATSKLMWVMAQTHDMPEIGRMMQTNYCGEINTIPKA